MFDGKSDFLLKRIIFSYHWFFKLYFSVVRVKHVLDSFDCSYTITRDLLSVLIRLFVLCAIGHNNWMEWSTIQREDNLKLLIYRIYDKFRNSKCLSTTFFDRKRL